MARRPLADALRDLPKYFPELAGGGIPERLFRDVLLPQVITKAKTDEAGTRKMIVEVMRRCLEVVGPLTQEDVDFICQKVDGPEITRLDQ